MKILVVGSGGREHALAWKIAGDSARPQVFCAPGNAGTAGIAVNLPIEPEDIGALTAWAAKNRPELTVIGPEAPLCAGLSDQLQAKGLKVFGPSAAAARLEGSKAFAKDVLRSAGVPTADYGTFTDLDKALGYARALGGRCVVKADGLAAGKGVTVCTVAGEAEKALRAAMADKVFGAAGQTVVVEEMLEGEEASILALIDGRNIVMLASSQDHKRVFDNDQGPNTGGMGAYSPAPVVTEDLWPVIREQVFERTLTELRKRGITYKGVLYAGVMIRSRVPRVLEFNCRFGDPETQAVLPRLATDLVPALEACADGNLTDSLVRWRPEAAVCVVMASGGYPGSFAKGKPIDGLDAASKIEGVTVFHAGTRLQDGRVVTAGGRVLGVTALGTNTAAAAENAYRAAAAISFEGAHYRKDIAARALKRGR